MLPLGRLHDLAARPTVRPSEQGIGPAPRSARTQLESLVGSDVCTRTTRLPNRVLLIVGDEVGTGKSPGGQAVPIAWVQDAIDMLVRDGAVEVTVEAIGHRSAFVGAVPRVPAPELRLTA